VLRPQKYLEKEGFFLVQPYDPKEIPIVFVHGLMAVPYMWLPVMAALEADGARLIMLPGQILTGIGSATLHAASSAAGIKGTYLPNSIHGLEPDSPLLISMNTVPIKSRFHSIIGNGGRWNVPLEKSSDEVVPYWSAHLDGALSEKIVPAIHTTAFQNPEAITEMKRILRLHLQTTAR
jgi:hypothetical protein